MRTTILYGVHTTTFRDAKVRRFPKTTTKVGVFLRLIDGDDIKTQKIVVE